MGILSAALGLFLIAYPLVTATITTVVLGWTLIFVSIAQFVFAAAFADTWKLLSEGPCWWVVWNYRNRLGVCPDGGHGSSYRIAGDSAFGPTRIGDGFDAIVSLALGMLIIVKWPSSSVWAIGTLVGAAVLMGGIARSVVASKVPSGA